MFYQLKEFYWYYLGALISLIITHFSTSSLPFLIQKVVGIGLEEKISLGQVYPFILVAVSIIVFRTLSRLLFFYPARILQKYLRLEIIEFISSKRPKIYQSYSDGQMYQLLMNDINQMRAFVGFALLQVGNVVVALSIAIPKLSSANPLYLKYLIPLFLSVTIFSVIAYLFMPLRKKALDLQGDVQQFLIESYNAKNTIKGHHRENEFVDQFQKVSLKELNLFFKSGIGLAFTSPIMRLGAGLSFIWAAYDLSSSGLKVSELILISSFIFLLMEPLSFISWIGVIYAQSLASWKRIKSFISLLDSGSELSCVKFATEFEQSRVLNISWSNKEFQINLRPNHWIALVGPTGGGKSTLLEEITYSMKKAEINFTSVLQTPHLFNDTIFNNIFLLKKPSEFEIQVAKELIILFDLEFDQLPLDEVLELEVGENGKRLSGGQAKRVALLRSIMTNAKILIWDDPFSAIDIGLEEKIFLGLRENEYLKDKCFLITTHRLTTLKFCDQVTFIDYQGEFEQGDVTTLLSARGKVHDFFQEQMV